MHFIIHFLLIGGLSFLIGKTKGSCHIEKDLKEDLRSDTKNIIRSKVQRLTFVPDQKLGGTDQALVWKGIYSDTKREIFNQTVAIKIMWDDETMDAEMAIFKALNATKDPNIEEHGIPRVYFYGTIIQQYYAIAMTLFDGTLNDRYEEERKVGRTFSALSILSIFKQAIEVLKYLNSMHVVHNDIKPENIFLRGERVFIADFDLSTLNDDQSEGRTILFATANYYGKRPRHPMDDLESLVYSMWYIADVPMVRDWNIVATEGFCLNKCTEEEAKARILAKLEHFQQPHVHEVMKYICVDEMLSGRPIPLYDDIIAKLNVAIMAENQS